MIKAAATLKSLQFRQTNLTDCYGRLSFGTVFSLQDNKEKISVVNISFFMFLNFSGL